MESSPEIEEIELSDADRALVVRAREKAFLLYEGKQVAHRSCGIALAETFGVPSRPYQALRRGGITGDGECGAIKAGELILGEILGDPDPRGAVTPALRSAIRWYGRTIRERLAAAGILANETDIVCNSLTRRFPNFAGADRQAMCTNIAAEVAAVCAEALLKHGAAVTISPLPET